MATIRKRGDKYQVQVRRQGVGSISKSFLLLKDAQAWAREKEIQADRHELEVNRRSLAKITLGQLVIRYRDTVTIHKRGGGVERVVLNAFLKHPICRRKLSELTGEHFAAYRDERLQRIKPSSLKRQLAPIHHLFETAQNDWGLPIRKNPLDNLRLVAPDQKRERRLQPGEWERLLSAARTCRNQLMRPIIELAVETGMRRSEILNIHRDEVDIERRCLLIPNTKNGNSRTIPLTHFTLALLHQQLSEAGDRVFPITANAFRLSWERLRDRAKIHDLRFHDLRHEAISRLFEKQLTIPEVALISGHRDVRMLFRYAHGMREGVLAKLNCPEKEEKA